MITKFDCDSIKTANYVEKGISKPNFQDQNQNLLQFIDQNYPFCLWNLKLGIWYLVLYKILC